MAYRRGRDKGYKPPKPAVKPVKPPMKAATRIPTYKGPRPPAAPRYDKGEQEKTMNLREESRYVGRWQPMRSQVGEWTPSPTLAEAWANPELSAFQAIGQGIGGFFRNTFAGRPPGTPGTMVGNVANPILGRGINPYYPNGYTPPQSMAIKAGPPQPGKYNIGSPYQIGQYGTWYMAQPLNSFQKVPTSGGRFPSNYQPTLPPGAIQAGDVVLVPMHGMPSSAQMMQKYNSPMTAPAYRVEREYGVPHSYKPTDVGARHGYKTQVELQKLQNQIANPPKKMSKTGEAQGYLDKPPVGNENAGTGEGEYPGGWGYPPGGGGGGGGYTEASYNNGFRQYQPGYPAQGTAASPAPTMRGYGPGQQQGSQYANANAQARYLQLLTNWRI